MNWRRFAVVLPLALTVGFAAGLIAAATNLPQSASYIAGSVLVGIGVVAGIIYAGRSADAKITVKLQDLTPAGSLVAILTVAESPLGVELEKDGTRDFTGPGTISSALEPVPTEAAPQRS